MNFWCVNMSTGIKLSYCDVFNKARISYQVAKTTYIRIHGRHESIGCNFASTVAWSSALASPLLLATPTLILAKHPLVPTTEDSVGRRFDPHVSTSSPVKIVAVLMRDRTNLNCAAEEQVVLETVG